MSFSGESTLDPMGLAESIYTLSLPEGSATLPSPYSEEALKTISIVATMYYRDHCQQSTQSGLSNQSQRSVQTQQTSLTQDSGQATPVELDGLKAQGLKIYSKMLIQQVETRRPEGEIWESYFPSPETELAEALVEEKVEEFIAHGAKAKRQDILDLVWQEYWKVYGGLPELWNEHALAHNLNETVGAPGNAPANEPVAAPIQGIERIRGCFGRPSLFH
jgi:hypothetical protein